MAPFTVGSFKVKQRGVIPRQGPPATPKTTELPAGHKKRPGSRVLPSPIIFDEDQVLTLRDGTKIRADIFRPKTEDKVPAIVMWGPYGKSGSGILNLSEMPLRAGIPESRLSGYEDFEGLDPAEWVPKGYAIINVDPRGVNDSEGDIRWWGTSEGQDGYDAIEEIAKLPWCTGKVALAGNSWLAVSQYFIAAEQPPSLACIAPLEGLSDPAREETYRGGILQPSFSNFIAEIFSGRGQQEDWTGNLQTISESNEYVEDKRARIDKINIPSYIGASYSTNLHTIGSLRAFEEIGHEKKWLVLHSTQEWYDLYTDERTQDLSKFFDHYLRGIENDWQRTSPVRMAFLNYNKPAIVNQEFEDLPWHLSSAHTQQLYFNSDGSLSKERPAESSTLEYQADSSDKLSFSYNSRSKTTITGPSTVVINIASPNHNDLDVYTHIYKADANGQILTNLNIPLPEGLSEEVIEKATTNRAFRYWGPDGWLRASRRHVSPELSGKTWKTLSYGRPELVTPSESVRLEIQLWPTGIVFEAGEQLILRVSGEPLGIPALPHLLKPENGNKGKHIVQIGGEAGGYLQLYTLE
ncbi:hypothetical protein FSARC_4786 [Fusarium sarcochroum]|uniref:Xaa-Pro dipeptidyl-peptidase C-terminal domain-containing protein n=1 Tax=Fusarium sarcochroum TaxID=1208366 RepID=A0A8H4U0V3_9HYPO|nr:hypothetical protein FSARC_4786 [Fusarium sarcochroum]